MRRLPILVCLLAAAALVAPYPAQAIPFERPVFLTPVEDQSVSGRVDIEVSSQSPYVRLSMNPASQYSRLVKVVDGLASASFSTLGFDGRSAIHAQSCTDDSNRSCGSDRTIDVLIDNPAPTITAPQAEDEIYPSDDVVATVDLEVGSVQLVVPGFRNLAPDTAAPFKFVLDSDLLQRGRQYWEATACNPSGTKCEGAVHRIRVDVHKPGIRVFRGGRAEVSPNGDGVEDTAIAAFILAEPSAVVAEVWQGNAQLRSIDLGDVAADDAKRVDLLDDLGGPLPDGEYEVLYRASLTADSAVQEVAPTRLTVDTAAPVVLNKQLPYGTFFPYRDRYRDVVQPTIRLNERVEVHKVEIRNATDDVVYSSGAPERSRAKPFTYGFLWDGRLLGGPLPRGEYRISWTLIDAVGNATSATQRVTIDDDLVVERDVTMRVKASAAVDWEIGRCSAVRKDPRTSGGRLLLSDEKCDSSPYDNRKHIVAAYYRVTIPKSLRPQRLGLDVFGGAVRSGSYLGTAVWWDSKGKYGQVNWSGPATERHDLLKTRTSETADVLRGRRLYWVSFVNQGMQYRVRDFTVTTTRAFLVEPATPAPIPAALR